VEGAGRDGDDEAPRRRTPHREADNDERTRSTWPEVRVATSRTRSLSAIRAGHGYLAGLILGDMWGWVATRHSGQRRGAGEERKVRQRGGGAPTAGPSQHSVGWRGSNSVLN
jgi:hypothetical protein